MWNVTAKVIPVVTGGDWKHFRTTQYRESTRSGHYRNNDIGHCTQTAGSADVIVPISATGPKLNIMSKVQNIQHGEITLHVALVVSTE
jgi:hypothetical protein